MFKDIEVEGGGAWLYPQFRIEFIDLIHCDITLWNRPFGKYGGREKCAGLKAQTRTLESQHYQKEQALIIILHDGERQTYSGEEFEKKLSRVLEVRGRRHAAGADANTDAVTKQYLSTFNGQKGEETGKGHDINRK